MNTTIEPSPAGAAVIGALNNAPSIRGGLSAGAAHRRRLERAEHLALAVRYLGGRLIAEFAQANTTALDVMSNSVSSAMKAALIYYWCEGYLPSSEMPEADRVKLAAASEVLRTTIERFGGGPTPAEASTRPSTYTQVFNAATNL